MNIRLLPDPRRYATMSAAELRETFLFDGLFTPGEVRLSYVDVDRTVVGGAVPTGTEPLALPNPADLRAAFFTERRELGILNVGGPGTVTIDGQSFAMDRLDCLYVGRGRSGGRSQPSKIWDGCRRSGAGFLPGRTRRGHAAARS